jgi:hypothetical protein
MKHVKDGKNKAQQKHTEYKKVMKKKEKNKKKQNRKQYKEHDDKMNQSLMLKEADLVQMK